MRSNAGLLKIRHLAVIALAAMAAAYALPASAGSNHRDHVYADSFGNLVIESAAGYKRIIVGQGKLAKELANYTSAGQPKVVYADDIGRQDCYRPPVFVKGRSYMYGLSDGEMPQLSPCR
jgi:hypothetical protein